MKVAIGCDHGALDLKNAVIKHLEKKGIEVKDFGTYTLDSCDYPEFAAAAAKAVACGECEKGIVLCTTGIGVSISANKVDGIRCALLADVWSAKMTRLHNDTNMMALGAGVVGENLALEIVDTWIGTEFSGDERPWRREWQPTPVFLPGDSHGWRSLLGCNPWGRTESDTTEAT